MTDTFRASPRHEKGSRRRQVEPTDDDYGDGYYESLRSAGWTDEEIKAHDDYLNEMAARNEVRQSRVGKEPPMLWGTALTERNTNDPEGERLAPLGEPGYFCVPCWKDGDETGFHPHSQPPCDPYILGRQAHPRARYE